MSKLPAKLAVNMQLTSQQVNEIFVEMDTRKTGKLSLAVIDEALLRRYPDTVHKHKQAMMRAYRLADKDNSGFIEAKECGELLYALAYFDQMFEIWQLADTHNEDRLDYKKFKSHVVPELQRLKIDSDLLHVDLNGDSGCKDLFAKFDVDGGGYIRFEEFCVAMSKLHIDRVFLGESDHIPTQEGLQVQKKQTVAPKKVTAVNGSPIKTEKSSKSLPVESKLDQNSTKLLNSAGLPAKLTLDMVIEETKLKQFFDQFDDSNTGLLSLAKIDKVMCDLYPDTTAMHKPALIRAYKSADKDQTGFVEFHEFKSLLWFLAYYDDMYQVYRQADPQLEGRVDFARFKKFMIPQLIAKGVDIHLNMDLLVDANAQILFNRMDSDRGGFILFHEFCIGMAGLKLNHNNAQASQMQDDVAKEKTFVIGSDLKKKPSVKQSPVKVRESVRVDSKQAIAAGLPGRLTMDMQLSQTDLEKYFKRLDINKSGTLSLAEIDKAMTELYPQTTGKHKKALMRAYKSADASGNGYVELKEFGQLLTFLAYYDELFEVFEQADAEHSGRLDFQQFKQFIVPQLQHKGVDKQLQVNLTNEKSQKEIYGKFDQDGGGYVRFDEFCYQMATLKIDKLFVAHGNDSKFIEEHSAKAKPLNSESKTTTPIKQKRLSTQGQASPPKAAANQSTKTTSVRPKSRTPSVGTPKSPSVASSVLQASVADQSERKQTTLQNENQRLQLQINLLREQVASLGGKVDDQKHSSALATFDALKQQNQNIQNKLQSEQQRYFELHNKLLAANAQVKELEHGNRKETIDDSKRSREQNQVVTLQRELKEARSDTAKFERMYQDVCRKYEQQAQQVAKLQEKQDAKSKFTTSAK